MYRTILVPLDGSGSAEIVIPYVVEIAGKLESEITLASVSESGAPDIDHLYRAYLDRIKEQVHFTLKYWQVGEKTKVFSKILLGRPADEIIRYSDEIDADLILMASRGSSGKGPWILGNVAAKVLRATQTPVLLIRTAASSTNLEQKRLIKKIMVPLDGSKIGESVFPFAESLANVLSAELILFQAVEPVLLTSESSSVEVASAIQKESQSRQASALTYLNAVGEQLKAKGLKVSPANIIASMSPADEIIEYAEANAIDLIAMSTHGRTGVGRWVFGSVTDKVLHTGDTPVLVVRAGKTRT